MKPKKSASMMLLVFGCATLVALVYSSHLYLYHRLRGNPIALVTAIAESLADWYAWAALAPFIMMLALRFPLRKGRLAKSILFHIVSGLFFALLHLSLQTFVDQTAVHSRMQWAAYKNLFGILFARTYYFGILVYWMIVIVRNAFEYYKDQELVASRLEGQLAQSQLQALKMQLQPHFLFNTLHAISSLIQQDPKLADRMVAALSDLLRMALAQTNLQVVTLEQELDFLEKYLTIERLRFQDRLQVKIGIDPSILKAQVPNLLLQPLVENAVRHGVANNRGPGVIEVRGEKQNGNLVLTVLDNGKGLAEEVPGEGIGLGVTRARMMQLYGNRQVLEIRKRPEGGAEVIVTIPFHHGGQN